MLSERDRTLLAPHLALLRAAQRKLAAAQRAFDDTERQLAESTTDSDWRDRRLLGLFSRDDSRTRRFRQARSDHQAAEAALTAARADYTKYAERIDGLFEPMLSRDDPAYRVRLATVRACDKALHAGEEMRYRIAATLSKPGTGGQPSRGGQTWHEVEFAKLRFAELVTELGTSVPALHQTMDRAAQAVGARTVPRLDAPPGTTTAVVAEQHLRGLQHQLDAALETITRWRAHAEQSRVAALRAAQDEL